MPRARAILAGILATHAISHEAVAQTETHYLNALKDSARAQERQGRAQDERARIMRDQARRADSDRANAQRDARSMRRLNQ